MKKQDIIKELNKPFECKKNCGKCCGIVPFTKAEKDALPLELQEKYTWEVFNKSSFIPLPKDGLSGETISKAIEKFDCVFLTEGEKCSIYEKRPLICKAFGKVNSKGLICPESCKTSNTIQEKDFLKII